MATSQFRLHLPNRTSRPTEHPMRVAVIGIPRQTVEIEVRVRATAEIAWLTSAEHAAGPHQP